MSLQGVGNLFKHLGFVKAEKAGDALVSLQVWLDKKDVAKAAIRQKLEEQRNVNSMVIEAKHKMDKEKNDFEVVLAEYTQKLNAATRAKAAMDASPDDAEAKEAFNELTAGLEDLVPKLDKEKREYEKAAARLERISKSSDQIAKDLLTMQSQLDDLVTAIADAELEKDELKREEALNAKLAGLETSANKFDTAFDALQKDLAEKTKENEVTRLTIEQLTPEPAAKVSTAASRFMDEAKGDAVSSESLEDKLARLSAKVN